MRAGRLLRVSLWLGAGYDAGVGGALLLAPLRLAAWLGLDPPALVYLRLIAVMLLMLAGFYALAAGRPEGDARHARYTGGAGCAGHAGNVWIAIAGRLGGAAVLLGEAARSGRLAWLLLGLADLCFGLAHLVFRLVPSSSPGGGMPIPDGKEIRP